MNLTTYRGPTASYFAGKEAAAFNVREWLACRQHQLDSMTWADLAFELEDCAETLQCAIRQHDFARVGRIVCMVREAYAARLADRECDIEHSGITAQQAANLACIGVEAQS